MENLSSLETWLTKSCGSIRTRQPYSRAIQTFSDFAGKYGVNIETLKDSYRTAKYAGEMEKEKFLDKMHDLVETYACELKSHHYASMYQAFCLSVVRSYLAKGCGMKDVDVALPKHVFVTYHNRDLTKEDIRKILENANLRDRVFFLMMAESGMRPQTLVQITYADIKADYEANRTPMKIELPSLILKDNPQARFTFIGVDGARALKEYLSTRGKLDNKDPLFLPERVKKNARETLGPEPFSNSFSRLATKLKLAEKAKEGTEKKPRPVRLYGLRKYFNNNMKADRAYIEFWMGHSNISDHYISDDIEAHRKRYAEGYPALRIYESIYEAAETLTAQAQEIELLKKELDKERTARENLIETLKAQMAPGGMFDQMREKIVVETIERIKIKERIKTKKEKAADISKENFDNKSE